MNDNIVLTKIAKLVETNTECNEDQTTFEYDNKRWALLDAYNEDSDTIMDILEYKLNWHYNLTLSDEKTHVNLAYKNLTTKKAHRFDDLFGAIFLNFERHEKVANRENKLLKTYVTTTLYEALQKQHKASGEITQQMLNALTLPAKFLPTLCDYQKQAVLWLKQRERLSATYPDFFVKLHAKDNETIVYKHLTTPYLQADRPPDLCLPPGGILADEMGLGKTVEMLALILLNPRPDIDQNVPLHDFFANLKAKRQHKDLQIFCICVHKSKKNIVQCKKCSLWQHKKCVGYKDGDDDDYADKPYLCPGCWQTVIDEYGLLKTKATFIVSPNTIKLQWLSEVQRHINPSLRVLIYDGALSSKWISPWAFAEYDLVLTDYTALRGDIYYTKENTSDRTARNKPRSLRRNTPILMMEWWRVLLDEAQMVESNSSKVALLVRGIPAINRWAVTGTPIQRSLQDLQPLLKFIGFEAAAENSVWKDLENDFVLQQQEQQDLNDNNENKSTPQLIEVLQKCMWRTCKKQISSELKIPPQQEIVHRLEFDNLEKLFYNEQHAECHRKFILNVDKYTQRMTTISPQIMKVILQPFLKIRQSCSIPVVVSNSSKNGHVNNSQPHTKFLQPKEFHEYLKTTNELECKTELRTMASTHNGLAALYFIQKQYKQAMQHYETVLKLAKDYSDMNITVDKLLQVHALYNIMQLKIMENSKTKDLGLEAYETQYNALEWKYLETYASTLTTVKTSYEAAVTKIDQQIIENLLISMADGLEELSINDDSILMQKIQEECLQHFNNSKLEEIRSNRSLLFVIQLWSQKITKMLRVLCNEINELKYFTENVRSRNQVNPAIWRQIMNLVNTVYDCHLSEIRDVKKTTKQKTPQKKKDKKELCKMCLIRDSMNQFECLLFDKTIDKETNDTDGLENPSFEMFLCKLIFGFLKNKLRNPAPDLDQCWSNLENLQTVCKRLIKLWIEMEYTIKAYDELNMCKLRLTLTDDPKEKSIYKIMQNEIPARILEQQNELMVSQRQFTVKLARLRYIKHLEKDNDMGACPICQLTEDIRYAVLECGHHICFTCLKTYTKNRPLMLKCSLCRNVQQSQNIHYVSRTKFKANEKEKIKGDYSSKITFIVRLILKLINAKSDGGQTETTSDEEMENNVKSDIKILIFSQWEPILWNIALALRENDITFRAKCTAKTIEEFKDPNLGISCLLMPFERGSKGLNLVEATHVFLVEPILNPGEELQAIGRVHRFGQTRPTTVHRFIVDESIEENIYNFIVSSSSSNNSNEVQNRWEFENISLQDFENIFSLKHANECV